MGSDKALFTKSKRWADVAPRLQFLISAIEHQLGFMYIWEGFEVLSDLKERIIIMVVMMMMRYGERQLSAMSLFHLWNIY